MKEKFEYKLEILAASLFRLRSQGMNFKLTDKHRRKARIDQYFVAE
jgi:hypothetical protein